MIKIYKFIKFIFIYSFLINIQFFSYDRNLKAQEIILNLDSCNWIPIKINSKSKQTIRFCLANNQKDLYEVKFNIKNKKIISKRFIGLLNGTMVYKGNNLIDQNQDTLIKLKRNNGKLFFYKCLRIDCYDSLSNYKIIGIKKYFWKI